MGITLLVLAFGAGALVRYEVLQGRTEEPTPTTVSSFSDCLNASYDLDITGTTCTTPTGEIFIKSGSTNATTTPTPVTTTTATTTPPATMIVLGSPTRFTLQDTRTFAAGHTISLTAINDSRCKPNVQCIWAGELATDWQLTTATGTRTISLGTVRTTSTTTGGYLYTLTDASTSSATILISAAASSVSQGTVQGAVTIGPICPVESIDHPCVVPPETYTARSVIVYAADKVTELEQQPLDHLGHYTLSLKPGTYGLQIRPAGIGAGEIKPVTVTPNHTSIVDFTIDTGIR